MLSEQHLTLIISQLQVHVDVYIHYTNLFVLIQYWTQIKVRYLDSLLILFLKEKYKMDEWIIYFALFYMPCIHVNNI